MSAEKGPFRLGLTGSIAMGKSTTSNMFREAGIPVWDADAVVHKLYSKGGAAVPAIAALAPDAICEGAVDRGALSAELNRDPGLLARLEAAVHPLVRDDREGFLAASQDDIVVLDIPLLFETGGEEICDAIVVVTAPRDIQTARALERPGMTAEKLQTILARQMPDAEKRARADFVIDTSKGLEHARARVHDILNSIRENTHA